MEATASNSETGSADTAKSVSTGDQILGESRNYGIVCDNYTQTCDAETNIVAKTAKTNSGQHTGNDWMTSRDTQTYLIGKVDGYFGVKGDKATVITPDGSNLHDGTYTVDSSKTKEEIDAKIDQLKQSALQRLDTALINAQETEIEKDPKDNQKWCLNLLEKGAGTYKVLIKDKNIFSEAGKLNIRINAGTQAIILSVDDSLIPENGTLDFASYNINGTGSASYNTGTYGDKPAKAIIWDFRNSNLKTINIGTSSGNWINGSSNGIFIAPNADINLNSTSSGWIICKNMHVEYGEWHNIDQSENLAPEDKPTTPGEDNTGESKGESETVKPGDEGENKDKPDTPKPGTGESNKPSDSGKTDTGKTGQPSGGTQTPSTGDNGSSSHTPTTSTEPGTPSTPIEVPVTPTTPVNPDTPSTPSTPSVDTPTVPTNTVINPNPENPKNTEPTTTPTAPVHTTHNDVQNNKSNAQNESGQPVTVTHTGKTVKSTAVSPKTSERNTASVQNTSSVQPAGTAASATDASVPKTADQTSLLLYVTLFGGAAAALVAVLALKRKENE